MPTLPDSMAYGPGGAMPGPLVGALVPVVFGPTTYTGAITTGGSEFGFCVPFDCRVESVTWASNGALTGTNTIALFSFTAVDGCIGGTAVMAATSINAGGTVEGAGLSTVAAARNIAKGRFLAFDIILAAGQTATLLVVTVNLSVCGHAVADVAAR